MSITKLNHYFFNYSFFFYYFKLGLLEVYCFYLISNNQEKLENICWHIPKKKKHCIYMLTILEWKYYEKLDKSQKRMRKTRVVFPKSWFPTLWSGRNFLLPNGQEWPKTLSWKRWGRGWSIPSPLTTSQS